MKDRIIIDFDDEEENPKPDENRIVINFDEEKKKIDIDNFEASYEEKILKSKINSYYRGNHYLNNSYETELKFPEGIEQGFRKKFSININDEFFNSILESNRFIILSSKSGNVFLADRFSGKIREKIFFENDSFEKTGLVYDNVIYLNSLKKIYRIEFTDEEKVKHAEVYDSGNDYFIWSNLNRCNQYIVFTQYNVTDKTAALKIFDLKEQKIISGFPFEANKFLDDKICIAGGCAYLLVDSALLAYDIEKLTGTLHPLKIKFDENSFIFYLNYRIYITSNLNELFYIDLPALNYDFKYTGIKNNYINSAGGFADNIFMGTLDGWKYYKSSGLQIYFYEDEYENKIESISRNVLVVSQKNKIVFCNLSRFQEAEGYIISSNEKKESIEIISAVISGNEIFVLTRSGVLEAYTNDKLNIHI